MRLDGPLDLNLLRVFVAIYEARSVTHAAERLEVTQPTISYGLAKMRKAYADRLFVRGPAGLTPTSLAEQLFLRFRDALASVESTLEERREFDPTRSTRRFRLAMSDIGVLFFAPPLLRRFQEIAPRIEVEIIENSESVVDALAAGRLDFAIGNLPSLGPHTRSAVLFREHYVCLMSAGHPSIRDTMTLREFASARHIMVASPQSGHRLVDEELARRGISRNVVARIPQFTVLPQLLSQSDLLVVLPSRVAQLYVAQGGLKAMPLPVSLASFDVQVHWHMRQESGVAHQWLHAEIVKTLSAL
jgi:DNA-binding transcriptional LysR family regulator